MRHARPHLQTHGRSQGHSAVAGAAYRLGLRLYDQRSKTWHDYRKRKLGEEIVAALTLAPPDAPDWASDPGELWNRVEAAELRKDSQVARDYRIPVPLGLSDVAATALATQMAQFIVDELHTSVSMGLHRDADVDTLGVVKPKDKQGFHAHLYFPTRKVEAVDQGDGTSAWELKTKFAFLTGGRSSSDFVERLNEYWAQLANELTSDAGLTADYDHRSYVRQGLPIEPQPTLGTAVVAMERRGFFTRKGNALRDIMLPSMVYETVHADDVAEQREKAVMDIVREGARQSVSNAPPVADSNGPELVVAVGRRAEIDRVLDVSTGAGEVSDVPDGWARAPSRPIPLPPHASLMARFEAALPIVPVSDQAREVLIGLLKLVQTIERALRALTSLAGKLMRHEEDNGRRVTAQLDTRYELDLARKERAAARERLARWETDHPWRLFAAKTLNGGSDNPERVALVTEVHRQDRNVQELKQALASHRSSLDDLGEEATALETLRSRSRDQLKRAMEAVVALGQTWIPTLLAVVPEGERGWVEEALPKNATNAPANVHSSPAPLEKLAVRFRPAPRHGSLSP